MQEAIFKVEECVSYPPVLPTLFGMHQILSNQILTMLCCLK